MPQWKKRDSEVTEVSLISFPKDNTILMEIKMEGDMSKVFLADDLL